MIEELSAIARSRPVVFPVHPRTRARLAQDVGPARGLKLVDPVGYIDFLALESFAAGVLTDSGGVQEETTFLRVPCFTLRENTERPVTLTQGTNRLLGLRPDRIGEIPELLARATTNLPLQRDGMAMPPAASPTCWWRTWSGRAAPTPRRRL